MQSNYRLLTISDSFVRSPSMRVIEMKAKFRHTWIRLQDSNESACFSAYVPGMKEVGGSKIEKATGSSQVLICLLRLTTGMTHKPPEFKLGRSWYSHAGERDFQARHAAGRTISEAKVKTQVAR